MNNNKAATAFEKLLDISDRLLGSNGCAWDRKQTLSLMRESVLEEALEVIEAIESQDDQNLIEELGDLLYNVIFFCKLAQKESRFEMIHPIEKIMQKLISRHPHVFGNKKLDSADAVVDQWEELKREEKPERESLMDGIHKAFPALLRAYKICGKMQKSGYQTQGSQVLVENEEELGELLWELTSQAKELKLNPEIALRKTTSKHEKAFREWEKSR